MRHSDVLGQCILDRGDSRCKCPEVGLCFRDSREVRGRRRGREQALQTTAETWAFSLYESKVF